VILSIAILALLTLQRVFELGIGQRNTRRLIARGAYEVSPEHYPAIVALHAAWLIGLWILAWNRPPHLGWLGVFCVLQAARIWVIASLGDRWTTRIIVLPGAQLVRRGPYRFLDHPNYLVVAGEILTLPLAFGLPLFAAVFSALNAAALFIRIRAEQAALAAVSVVPTSKAP
jgi:methyltransferase